MVELNARDGSVIQTLPGLSPTPAHNLQNDPSPGDIATDGIRVWVVDNSNSLVSELNAGNGDFYPHAARRRRLSMEFS